MASMISKIRRRLRARRHAKKKFASMNQIKANSVWRQQPFFRRAYDKYHLEVSGIPEMRCFFLQSVLRSLRDIEGDVAEAGTRHGKSALFMLEACEEDRQFYLFDSFEGISDPVPGKDSIKTAFRDSQTERLFSSDYEAAKKRFEPFDNVHIMKGWIPDRFPEVADRTFCLIHIDVDMYQPTLDSLEFFYPRLSKGGFIICDDYGSSKWPGARSALDEFFADKPEKPAELPQSQAFIVKH